MLNDVKLNNYKIALVEVEAVLNCLEHDDYCKIPKEIIDAIAMNKNKNYIFEYDENLEYKDWNFMPEAKAILYNIFKKYLATDEQIEYFKEKEKFERYKLEEEKKKAFQDRLIFNKKENYSTKEEKSNTNLENIKMTEYKEPFFLKIQNFIFKLLHISKN